MSADELKEVLPKSGKLSVKEVEGMVLCKPKMLAIKSLTLERLEQVAAQVYEEEGEKEEKDGVQVDKNSKSKVDKLVL